MASLHSEASNNLCCVCGFLVKRKDATHQSEESVNVIGETFGKILNPNTMPHYICHACWRTVQDFKKNRNIKISRKVVMVWEAHDDEWCKTCDLYLKRKKGGARKKGKSKGRPKTIGVWKESDIPSSNVSFEIEVSDLVATVNITTCTCVLCSGLIKQPLVTTCCHKGLCRNCLLKHTKTVYRNIVSFLFIEPKARTGYCIRHNGWFTQVLNESHVVEKAILFETKIKEFENQLDNTIIKYECLFRTAKTNRALKKLKAQYKEHHDLVTKLIKEKKQGLQELRKSNNLLEKKGAIFNTVEEYLKEIRVERQAFHSRSFTGNHCHVLLEKHDNLSQIPYEVTQHATDDSTIREKAANISEKFLNIFNKYKKCDFDMNSRKVVDPDILESSIQDFMKDWRAGWPNESIPPKYDFLEDHVVPFIKKWKVGLGFYGEQGGESLHKNFRALQDAYNSYSKGSLDKYASMMKMHHTQIHPKCIEAQPDVKTGGKYKKRCI